MLLLLLLLLLLRLAQPLYVATSQACPGKSISSLSGISSAACLSIMAVHVASTRLWPLLKGGSLAESSLG
jgi:hypothetical protein